MRVAGRLAQEQTENRKPRVLMCNIVGGDSALTTLALFRAT